MAKLYSRVLHPGWSIRTKEVNIRKSWQLQIHQTWSLLPARTMAHSSSLRQDTSSCSQSFSNLLTSHRISLKSFRLCPQRQILAVIINSLHFSLRLATFITCREVAARMLQWRVALLRKFLNTTLWMPLANLFQQSLALQTWQSFRTLRWFLALAVDSSSDDLGCLC